jgi:hypothetical protein
VEAIQPSLANPNEQISARRVLEGLAGHPPKTIKESVVPLVFKINHRGGNAAADSLIRLAREHPGVAREITYHALRGRAGDLSSEQMKRVLTEISGHSDKHRKQVRGLLSHARGMKGKIARDLLKEI